NAVRNFEAFAIAAVGLAQQAIGFVVADDLLGLGIEIERAAQAIRHVRKVDERRRDVAVFGGSIKVRGSAARRGVEEILEVGFLTLGAGAGMLLIAEPGFVFRIFLDGKVAFRTVEDVPDRVGFSADRSKIFGSGRGFRIGLKSGGRQRARAPLSDFGF